MRLFEIHSVSEVKELERELDKMFKPLGLDVGFEVHFVERILGREKNVGPEAIKAAFEKMKRKFKSRILKAKTDPKGPRTLLQDFDSDLNIVFQVEPKRGGKKGEFALSNLHIKQKPVEKYHNTTAGEVLKVGSKK
jgi:hypothetical protein